MEQKIFDELRRIIYDESGITLGSHKMALVSARVNKRIRALSLSSPEEYFEYLLVHKDDGEMIQLLDVISTNTTHFFRESVHFDFFAEQLKNWYDQGQRKFRIWCAASSSGEEPYTLAMTMREVLGHDSSVDMKILATDISTKILRIASLGEYSADKFKDVSNDLRSKYFDKSKKGDTTNYTAKPVLKQMISFKRLNLSVPPFPMKGPIDFIFCRNVMIYFDREVRSRLVNDAHRFFERRRLSHYRSFRKLERH